MNDGRIRNKGTVKPKDQKVVAVTVYRKVCEVKKAGGMAQARKLVHAMFDGLNKN